jgi:hypothetical protein
MIGSYCLIDDKLTIHVWIAGEISKYHGGAIILLKLQCVVLAKIPMVYRDSSKLTVISSTRTRLFDMDRKIKSFSHGMFIL